MDVQEAMTRKYGPLAAWQWGLAAAGIGYFILRKGKKIAVAADAEGGSLQRDPVTGEFTSSQSTSTVDPVTGKTQQSSYEASGPLNGFGGGVGLPMAYQMPYSQGDVYVNLPGDSQNLNPGTPINIPVSRPAHYPPKTASGPVTGQTVGGYWWVPQTRDDVRFMVSRAGLNPDPDMLKNLSPEGWAVFNAAASYARIVESNPQIDWTVSRSPEQWIGTPIYVPLAPGGWQTTGKLPAHASLQAPTGYTPPTQQTALSGTA